MRTACILAFAILTQGCAAIQALLPVAVSCVPKDAPKLPAVTPDQALKRMPDDGLVLTIAAERLELLQYSREAAAVIEGCK